MLYYPQAVSEKAAKIISANPCSQEIILGLSQFVLNVKLGHNVTLRYSFLCVYLWSR